MSEQEDGEDFSGEDNNGGTSDSDDVEEDATSADDDAEEDADSQSFELDTVPSCCSVLSDLITKMLHAPAPAKPEHNEKHDNSQPSCMQPDWSSRSFGNKWAYSIEKLFLAITNGREPQTVDPDLPKTIYRLLKYYTIGARVALLIILLAI